MAQTHNCDKIRVSEWSIREHTNWLRSGVILLVLAVHEPQHPFTTMSSGNIPTVSVFTVKSSSLKRLFGQTQRLKGFISWGCIHWGGFWHVCFRSERDRERERKHVWEIKVWLKLSKKMCEVSHLLWVMWLLTRCPAARAAIRESSPASTVPQTTRASWRAFSPGWSELVPWTPSIYMHTHRGSSTSECWQTAGFTLQCYSMSHSHSLFSPLVTKLKLFFIFHEKPFRIKCHVVQNYILHVNRTIYTAMQAYLLGLLRKHVVLLLHT